MKKSKQNILVDKNFDNVAAKFQRNIYQGLKGKIRLKILDEDLQECVFSQYKQPLTILDAGAGSGQYAAHLAKLGHKLVLADISEKMLAIAKNNFQEYGLEPENHQFINLPVQQLEQTLQQKYRLVLFHAVLEWLAEPYKTLQTLLPMVADDGYLSLMFFNRNSLIMQHVIFGNLGILEKNRIRGIGKKTLTPINPLEPTEVYQWLENAGLEILIKSGVRVMHDYSPRESRKEFPEKYFNLEQQYCRQEPFLSMGRYIHLVCRKKPSV